MAARPKTICRKAACGALIDAPGYCAKHAQLKVGWTTSHDGKTAAQRGLDYAWQKLRKRILSRDGGLCRIKGAGCEYVAREVDHIIGRAKAESIGWTRAQMDAESNLQSTCKRCHKAKSEAEAAAARVGG